MYLWLILSKLMKYFLCSASTMSGAEAPPPSWRSQNVWGGVFSTTVTESMPKIWRRRCSDSPLRSAHTHRQKKKKYFACLVFAGRAWCELSFSYFSRGLTKQLMLELQVLFHQQTSLVTLRRKTQTSRSLCHVVKIPQLIMWLKQVTSGKLSCL